MHLTTMKKLVSTAALRLTVNGKMRDYNYVFSTVSAQSNQLMLQTPSHEAGGHSLDLHKKMSQKWRVAALLQHFEWVLYLCLAGTPFHISKRKAILGPAELPWCFVQAQQ